MEFLVNQKSKTPYIVVEKTVLLLVIERFFSFKGMITFHSYYGSPCRSATLGIQEELHFGSQQNSRNEIKMIWFKIVVG